MKKTLLGSALVAGTLCCSIVSAVPAANNPLPTTWNINNVSVSGVSSMCPEIASIKISNCSIITPGPEPVPSIDTEECKNVSVILKDGRTISSFNVRASSSYIDVFHNEGYGFLSGPYSSNEQQKTISGWFQCLGPGQGQDIKYSWSGTYE